MKFSIATPVFNGMPALRRSVGSVRNQSYENLEHLIQDGGSTDGTTEWLNSQNGLDVQSGSDNGMYDAINLAWERSSGDIISWLNADEQYLPGTLSAVADFFNNHNDTDVVFGNGIVVDVEGRALAARKEIPLRGWYAINGTLYVMSCTMFARRRVLDKVGGLDASYAIVGDKDWIMRLLQAGIRFSHIPSFLGLFEVSDSNLSLQSGQAAESERVRRQYGAYQSRFLRLVPRACRYAEKAFRGCYGHHRIRYDYILDEAARSSTIECVVGSQWKWSADEVS